MLDILSPDDFSIKFEGYFTTREEAEKEFIEWTKRYEQQGYYSSGQWGRIPLEDLREYCSLIEVEEEAFEDEGNGF